MEKCIYLQTLCKPTKPNQFGCYGGHFRNCKIYQEITEGLIQLQQSGELEKVLVEEFDVGVIL